MSEDATRELKTFCGVPLRRMSAGPDGLIHLVFVTTTPGEQRRHEFVTEDQWESDGSRDFLPVAEYPDVRALAAQNLSRIENYPFAKSTQS